MMQHNVPKQEVKFMIAPLTKEYVKFCKKNKVAITKKGWMDFLGVHRNTLTNWLSYGGEIKRGVKEATDLIDKENRKTEKAKAAKMQGYKMNSKGKLTKTGFTKEEINEDMDKRMEYYRLMKERKKNNEYDMTNEANVIKAVDDFFDNLVEMEDKWVTNEFGEEEMQRVVKSSEIPTLPLLAVHLGISTNALKGYSPDAPGGDVVNYAKQIIEAESMQALVNAKGSYVGIMFAMKNGFAYIDKVTQEITDEKTDIQKLSDAELLKLANSLPDDVVEEE